MKKQYTKEQIIDSLIDYCCNVAGIPAGLEHCDWLYGECEREYNNAPCDPDGPTQEQEKNFNKIFDDYATRIINKM